jgi:hypothetical protein
MDNETPAEAAQRLEAALTRIAQAAAVQAAAQNARLPSGAPRAGETTVPAAVGARLDTIIAGLRAALAGKLDPTD